MELLPLLLMLVFLGISLYTTIQGRDRVKRALRTSFMALRVATPEGMVGGEALRIVKVYRQGMPLVYDDVFNIPLGPSQMSDSFWYCVGPGPSYFVAIPMVEVGLGRAKVTWAVRPLSQERMRAALQDDKDALREVFGSSGEMLA